ncbi:MAG: hypothetical protein MUC99_12075 [Anaerolineae bacterium]|nr:hypothetical protein [Anaerolineae bacterium]
MAMSKEELSVLLGDGWDALRNKKSSAALDVFRRVLNEDKENIDAHYGIGLAQRLNGDKPAARTAFETALRITEAALDELRKGSTSNDLSTSRDDRYMMLIRMLGQRVAEVSA